VSARYAAFLALDGRRCVVVGGGAVAERKVGTLLAAGASVVVVATRAGDGLRRAAADGRVTLHQRPYRHGDLAGARLAFAATDDPIVNAAVVAEARADGVPVNSVDAPDSGDFIVPATVRRGDVTVAISTGGRSPSFARHLREELEEWLTPARLELLDVVAEVRRDLQAAGRSPEPEVWRRAVDARLLRAVEAGDRSQARRHLLAALGAAAR
jgi:precorrin-2 dehydrogenase / sirohydrochlorin ferrochelatase